MDYYYKAGQKIQGFTITNLIGEGRYGIVYLAQGKHYDKYVIKQLKKNMLSSTQDKLFYEYATLSRLNDFRFPRFIGTFSTNKAEGYIMEYKAGRVFEDLIRQDRHSFTRYEIYAIADKLLDIIEVLQHQSIVHRDIRLPNVILTPQNELVLIDFGLARFIDNSRYVKQMDYWYLGDFLIHLYYTHYTSRLTRTERPWYYELKLTPNEKHFLKRLMGLERDYDSLQEIRFDLQRLFYQL